MIPTNKDISPTCGLDLDERVALEHFRGRTKSEAKDLFRENAGYYLSDLKWMGEVGFQFYFEPFLEELIESRIDLDEDIAEEILIAFSHRADDWRSDWREKNLFRRALEVAHARIQLDDVDQDAYPDLCKRLFHALEEIGEER